MDALENKDELFISRSLIAYSVFATVAQHLAHPLVVGKMIGSSLGQTPLHK